MVEKVRINKKNSNTGLVDVETQGVNLGDRAVDVAISEKATEDAVGFVDSIWGSKKAAGMIQQKRLEEAKLEQFRLQRELQLQADAAQRQVLEEQMQQQNNGASKRLQ